MDRINGHDWVDIGGGRHGFRGEDIPNGITGTEITDVWLNGVQEEITAVIEAAGITLDEDDTTQLLQALEARDDTRTAPFIPVVSVTVTAPPVGATPGQAWLIPAGATGAWAGKAQQIAQWKGSAWRFIAAPNGHVVGTPDGLQYVKLAGTYFLKGAATYSLAFVPVLSVATVAAPGSPAIGDLYAIGSAPTGAFAGKPQQIAEWNGAAWRFVTTPNGHLVGTPDGVLWIKKSGAYVPYHREAFLAPISFFMGQL